jgi:ribosomal protein S18 acetylase RimI-like enzyme
MDVTIRHGTPNDLDFLLAIDRISFEREAAAWDRSEREALIERFTRNQYEFSLIAWSDAHRIGGILLRHRSTSDSDLPDGTRSMVQPNFGLNTAFVDIFDIWVDPLFRCQGVARSLKLAAEEECRARQVEWIFTFQHPDNRVAIRMNESLGYEHIGTTRMWDDIDRICFRRRVPTRQSD